MEWPPKIAGLNGTEHYKFFGVVICLLFLFFVINAPPKSALHGIPLINGDSGFPFLLFKRKLRFLQCSQQLFDEGFSKSTSGFRIMSHRGEVTVLPSACANDLRNDERLSAREAIREEFLAHMAIFGPITGGPLTDEAVSKSMIRITRALGPWTSPMSEEIELCLQEHWTDSEDWHEVRLADGLLRMVVRVSARAFLGERLSRDPRWIEATLGYMAEGLTSVFTLHLFPKCLHRVLQWVLPMCRQTRAHLKQAHTLMKPEIERRNKMKKKPDDTMTWMEEASAGSSYDPVAAQLSLSFAATHTTSDFLTKLLVHLAQNEGIVSELREEITREVPGPEIDKQCIARLRLLDSVMKESQRMSPLSLATMTRRVRKSFKLSNGLELPPGSNVAVSTASMRDAQFYADPDTFDGHRFLNLGLSGKEHRHHFVTTSESHLGFGHGSHACPGRFFAAHELKIFLCHILTKYEFRLPDKHEPQSLIAGFFASSNPDTRMLIRRRKEVAI
ncbi:cytochrome P450 [Aspergillus stella-maris]|uniref:cytochrome P450 n=1 Tax=Aspergillus stella-maris TaxID=1810926 RepID=UPI003CCE5377